MINLNPFFVFFALLLPRSLFAHDFWLEPSSYYCEIDQAVSINLRVGEGFHGKAVARDPKQIVKFEEVFDQLHNDVQGLDYQSPAGYTRFNEAGIHVVGFRSNNNRIKLSAEKFNSYLLEEGLTSIIEQREKSATIHKSAKELYSRSAKTIISVGKFNDAKNFNTILGYDLELVPTKNPILPAKSLPIKVLVHGRPQKNLLVSALLKGSAGTVQQKRTNQDGLVEFDTSLSGNWLIKTVYMFPAEQDQGADWQSIWGSLTFETVADEAATEGS
ncbi:MAG: DUF4198 domain-containing protein [Bdellovibrionales bacterium]|nr:DUF4198 domain-containing protein [Bdellovibrionales bacterium]